MTRILHLLGVSLLFGSCAATGDALIASAPSQGGPTAPAVIVYGEWRDAARDRTVPYKLYHPVGTGRHLVIVHSHGLGGSREGSTYILEQVAAAGFVVVALQHAGSDTDLVRERGAAGIGDLAAGRLPIPGDATERRFRDLPFAIDQLVGLDRSGDLKGRLDLDRIGIPDIPSALCPPWSRSENTCQRWVTRCGNDASRRRSPTAPTDRDVPTRQRPIGA